MYLVDVQGLHGVFNQLNVDLCLLWLKLLVRNELSFWNAKKNRKLDILVSQNSIKQSPNAMPNVIMANEHGSVSSHLLEPCRT